MNPSGICLAPEEWARHSIGQAFHGVSIPPQYDGSHLPQYHPMELRGARGARGPDGGIYALLRQAADTESEKSIV